jgi:hypothetical protein
VSALWHEIISLSRIFGLRDRLRCPKCRKVGTWKPHGGWLDFDDTRGARRWLCKWCGHYVGPEGVRTAGVDFDKGCWDLGATYTPATAGMNCDPWKG